ncbi:MAG: oxidoreductase [Candidatus Raymondbacteria bacterium RifOxyB12_full_50_8]|nr:MAG: oxidoreductase [Candidatus Raymondbacteria bacterium RifOxyB12_full_50_8]
MKKSSIKIQGKTIPVISLNTVVVGSGAASLSCADHLYNLGVTDMAIVTERVGGGTSNNTGSDKQTYYKLSVYGTEGDCPHEMAKSLYNGGSMHRDLALIESVLSAQGFYRLVNIGVPFPHNRLGGFVGYKTDHDPRQRATSCGPWTSYEMVQKLLVQIKRNNITVYDEYEVIGIIADKKRACGIVALDKNKLSSPTFGLTLFHAENVVFGCGGPGGIYKTSVYPVVHTGAIGLALEVGAKAVNLTESQYGLASIKFRWNVSGTYQQVIPRYISTDANGGDEKEFLNPYFKTMGKLATDVFLKGYQWPFDPRKIQDYGSSLVDVLVYIETVVKGRRVCMDFRKNPRGGDGLEPFRFDQLEPEAYQYLEKSNALFGTPIERLKKMNPMAIDLYKKHNINIEKEPLEVAVCAQHNNGGLLGDIWWESNIRHLFPIGEVNGSHGVYRPGGSALNSGQVGSLRAAQRIAHVYGKATLSQSAFKTCAAKKVDALFAALVDLKKTAKQSTVGPFRAEFQQRMTDAGSHIRDISACEKAIGAAYEQLRQVSAMTVRHISEIPEAMKNRHLVLSHVAYLEAVREYLRAGGGSRGSYMVMDKNGVPVLPGMLEEWKCKPEDPSFRDTMLETVWNSATGSFDNAFTPRRPVPDEESWFENTWGDFVKGKVFE